MHLPYLPYLPYPPICPICAWWRICLASSSPPFLPPLPPAAHGSTTRASAAAAAGLSASASGQPGGASWLLQPRAGLTSRERLQAGIKDLQAEMHALRSELGLRGLAGPGLGRDMRRAMTPPPGRLWG